MVKYGWAQGAQSHRVGLLPISRYVKMGKLISFSQARKAGLVVGRVPAVRDLQEKINSARRVRVRPFPLPFCLVFPSRPTSCWPILFSDQSAGGPCWLLALNCFPQASIQCVIKMRGPS